MRALSMVVGFVLLLCAPAWAQSEDGFVLERRWLPFDLDSLLDRLPDPLWPWLLGAAAAIVYAALQRRRRRQRRTEPMVTRIEIELPGHAQVMGSVPGVTWGVSADPPANLGDDPRPFAALRVKVFAARPGEHERPAPDGTAVELTVRSEGTVESRSTLLVRGGTVAGAAATTLAGCIEGGVRCGPAHIDSTELPAAPAARWRRVPDGIDYLDPAEFTLHAGVPGSPARAEVRWRIVPGRAAALELVPPETLKPGTLPEGLPPDDARFIDVTEVRFSERPWYVLVPNIQPQTRVLPQPMRFGLGGWGRARRRGPSDELEALEVLDANGTSTEQLPGKALRLLGAVTDAAGNAVPLADDGAPGARIELALGADSTFCFTRPFAIERDEPNVAKNAGNTRWRCHPEVPALPNNVFFVRVVPALGATGANTELVFGIADGGVDVGRWRYRFSDRHPEALVRAMSWFGTGEPEDGWHYLAEIGVSLIPLLGDGRDLLIYGKKRINGVRLEPIDHAVALLALGGFVLDLAPGNPADVTAASAKTALKLLKRVPKEPAHRLAMAIAAHVERGMPQVDELGDLPKLATPENLATLKRSIVDLGRLGDALKRLSRSDAERLLGVLGAAVAVVQLQPLIEMVCCFACEEVLDVLEGLEEMEKP